MAKGWYIQMMGAEIGPLTSAELAEKVKLGQVVADTLVRNGPTGKWVPADRWKGLLSPPAEKPAPAPPPARPPAENAPAAKPAAAATDTFALAAAGTTAAVAVTWPDEEYDDAYHLKGEKEHKPYRAHADDDAYEFFEFVGFRSAISPPLYNALVAYTHEKKMSITQITRRAIADFIGKPEMGQDKKPDEPKPDAESEVTPEEAAQAEQVEIIDDDTGK